MKVCVMNGVCMYLHACHNYYRLTVPQCCGSYVVTISTIERDHMHFVSVLTYLYSSFPCMCTSTQCFIHHAQYHFTANSFMAGVLLHQNL